MSSVLNSPKKRPVPHINMTPALQEAITAYTVNVPSSVRCNPGDAREVREAMGRQARSFEDPAFFYADEGIAEAQAVEHLILLAQLHLEHLRAGNLA
jgi:hypothetical protein